MHPGDPQLGCFGRGDGDPPGGRRWLTRPQWLRVDILDPVGLGASGRHRLVNQNSPLVAALHHVMTMQLAQQGAHPTRICTEEMQSPPRQLRTIRLSQFDGASASITDHADDESHDVP